MPLIGLRYTARGYNSKSGGVDQGLSEGSWGHKQRGGVFRGPACQTWWVSGAGREEGV